MLIGLYDKEASSCFTVR